MCLDLGDRKPLRTLSRHGIDFPNRLKSREKTPGLDDFWTQLGDAEQYCYIERFYPRLICRKMEGGGFHRR